MNAPMHEIVLWACPVCRAFTTSDECGIQPPGGPALCAHPSGGYLYERALRTVDGVASALTNIEYDLEWVR